LYRRILIRFVEQQLGINLRNSFKFHISMPTDGILFIFKFLELVFTHLFDAPIRELEVSVFVRKPVSMLVVVSISKLTFQVCAMDFKNAQ